MYFVIDLAQKRQLASFDVVEGAISYVGALVTYFGLEKLSSYTITDEIKKDGSFNHLFSYEDFEAQVTPFYDDIVRDRIVYKKMQYAPLV